MNALNRDSTGRNPMRYENRPAERLTETKAGSLGLVMMVLPALFLGGCVDIFSTDVPGDPNVISADEDFTLEQTLVGATAKLFQAYDVSIVWSGKFGDEFVNSGTAPGIQDWDRRDVGSDCCGGSQRSSSIGSPSYVVMQQATRMASLLREGIAGGEFPEVGDQLTEAPEFARAATFEGFSKIWLADLFCSVAFDGTGPELTSLEAYEVAEDRFSQALASSGIEPDVRQAAHLGRARVRLLLGDEAGAVSDAGQVAPDFEWLAEYSTNSFAEQNMVHFRIWSFGNWSVGPAFRDLTVDDTGSPDPRVQLEVNPIPAFEPSQDLYAPLKVSSASSPLRIATGDEARYIIAEVEGGQAAVSIINEIRARHGVDEQWSPSTTDPDEIRDKVIDERKRTLFLDGVRLGDIRRYINKFDLDFFPTSTPQGFPMGGQTCVPLPDIERNNNPGI